MFIFEKKILLKGKPMNEINETRMTYLILLARMTAQTRSVYLKMVKTRDLHQHEFCSFFFYDSGQYIFIIQTIYELSTK